MMDNTELLALLDAVDDADSAATPGKWTVQQGKRLLVGYEWSIIGNDPDEDGDCTLVAGPCSYGVRGDDVFPIVTFRSAAPMLATKVRELLAENAKQEIEIECLTAGGRVNELSQHAAFQAVEAERDQLRQRVAGLGGKS